MSASTYRTDGVRSPARSGSTNLHRAVWRWHFYAGLLVLPFLTLLAITGAIYPFRYDLTL